MSSLPFWLVVAHVLVQAGFITRALLRPHRGPSSRLAWVLVILSAPVVGIIAYLLFGETNIGTDREERYRETAGKADSIFDPAPEADFEHVTERRRHIFRTGESISGLAPVNGNRALLLGEGTAPVDALIADIDAATDHVHLLFYIWLGDTTGTRVAEAAMRAAQRGVTVRAMADDLGSRRIIRSPLWQAMKDAGVQLARALPLDNPLLHTLKGRVDLRNHRKIVVIDNRITYCGSQNCADPEFLVKEKYAPWVDLMVRFEGPIARQNQWLFAQDWMAHVDEDLHPLLSGDAASADGTVVAQVNGSGPTVRDSAMPEMFETLLHAARNDLTLTTPYYVPTESMQSALCAAGHRGVRTRMVVPAQNDSWVVAAASRSYYPELLSAGVRIFEHAPGLLHAKSLTLDGEIAMIGSANLDRRSFELNYENNILLQDHGLTADLMARQESYIAQSTEITAADVAAWTMPRRVWNNTIAMMGPIL
ncbi:cardiolipin synthase [Psychromarinibacter sp. S121]|uniref:cardiolipin synthase n=1 Tax=Psychromarinibacter sp. S121 TaxID=3415127 RepID=UPI003C7C3026